MMSLEMLFSFLGRSLMKERGKERLGEMKDKKAFQIAAVDLQVTPYPSE